MNFYDLEFNKPNGETVSLSEFKDKAVLVVNTATKCGLAPQFDSLESLHQEYKDLGLVILGFPCNQFLGQEPESDDSMVEACRINHGVTFQLTQKVDVNGSSAHPIYKFLKKELGGTFTNNIKWNFTKFLIAPEGKPFKRYAPTTVPKEIIGDIKKVLNLL
ncbi:MAG: glutathione peroxidase [Algoriphagus sp.]|jgi:glutathione peroxidase